MTTEKRNRQLMIAYYIRKGLSREEAERKTDIPKGICLHCGATAYAPKARTCETCLKKSDSQRAIRWAKEKKPKPKPKVLRPRMIIEKEQPKQIETIILPDGIEIKKIPSMMPPGVRGRGPDPWDEDPAKARWVEKVLERMK